MLSDPVINRLTRQEDAATPGGRGGSEQRSWCYHASVWATGWRPGRAARARIPQAGAARQKLESQKRCSKPLSKAAERGRKKAPNSPFLSSSGLHRVTPLAESTQKPVRFRRYTASLSPGTSQALGRGWLNLSTREVCSFFTCTAPGRTDWRVGRADGHQA